MGVLLELYQRGVSERKKQEPLQESSHYRKTRRSAVLRPPNVLLGLRPKTPRIEKPNFPPFFFRPYSKKN